MTTALSTRSFALKSSIKTGYLVMAIAGSALLAGSLATGLAIGGAGTVSGVGILLAIWSRKVDPLRFGPTGFEAKLAPLAGLRVVDYDDILSIEIDKKQIVHVKARDQKDVKIPLRAFEPTDHDAILALLEGNTTV
ncbi:MAG: hypothetical protein KDC95_07675 [Planctomycetes bacterium]|nr:hypothetical protein [Planctomycetota bacterium]